MLRKQAGAEIRPLLLACCGAGLAQGMVMFSIMAGVEQLSGDGVQFQTFLLFLVSLCLFYRLFHYITERAALLALRGVMDLRIAIAARLRGISMLRFDALHRERLQVLLLDGQEMVVEAARMLMAAAANSVLIVVAFAGMCSVSLVGAVAVVGLMALGFVIFFRLIRGINSLMVPAQKAEMDFSANLRDLQDGFQHLKVHQGKTVDLFCRWLLPTLDVASQARVAMEKRHALGISFFAVFQLMLLGALLFLAPNLLPLSNHDIVTLLMVAMFSLSPMMSLVSFMPMLGKVEMTLGRMTDLKQELDGNVEQGERESVDALWKVGMLVPPAFSELRIRNLSFSYKGEDGTPTFTLKMPSFDLQRGEIVFLCGGNGSGKTTFMRLLCGLYAPDSGEMFVNNRPMTDLGVENWRNMFALVPADFHLFRHALGLRCPPETVRGLLRDMQLDKRVEVLDDGSFSTGDLSAGQRKRLALISALLEDRDICLFDEVAADFDPEFRRHFYEQLLPSLKARGKTILAVSHDDRFFSCADRIIRMADGTVDDRR